MHWGTIEPMDLPREIGGEPLRARNLAAGLRPAPARPIPAERAPGTQDPDAQEARRKMLADRLARNYAVVNGTYYEPSRPELPLFRADGDRRIVAHHNSLQSISAMVDLAESRGWAALRVQGAEGLQRAVWVEATSRGIRVQLQASRMGPTYVPTEYDSAMADRRREARSSATPAERRIERLAGTIERADSPSTTREGPSGSAPQPDRPSTTVAAPAAAVRRGADLPKERSSEDAAFRGVTAAERAQAITLSETIDASRQMVSQVSERRESPASGIAGDQPGDPAGEKKATKPALSDALRLLDLHLRASGFDSKERARVLAKAADKEAQLAADGKRVSVNVYDPAAQREIDRVINPTRSARQQRERSVAR